MLVKKNYQSVQKRTLSYISYKNKKITFIIACQTQKFDGSFEAS